MTINYPKTTKITIAYLQAIRLQYYTPALLSSTDATLEFSI